MQLHNYEAFEATQRRIQATKEKRDSWMILVAAPVAPKPLPNFSGATLAKNFGGTAGGMVVFTVASYTVESMVKFKMAGGFAISELRADKAFAELSGTPYQLPPVMGSWIMTSDKKAYLKARYDSRIATPQSNSGLIAAVMNPNGGRDGVYAPMMATSPARQPTDDYGLSGLPRASGSVLEAINLLPYLERDQFIPMHMNPSVTSFPLQPYPAGGIPGVITNFKAPSVTPFGAFDRLKFVMPERPRDKEFIID